MTRLRALRTRWLELRSSYVSRDDLHDLAAARKAVAELTARQSELEAENIALLTRLAFKEAGHQ